MQVKPQVQTNPQLNNTKVQPQKINKGMEAFLEPPKETQTTNKRQLNDEKMKENTSPSTNKTNLSPVYQSTQEEVKKVEKTQMDLEEKIREIEQNLTNSRIKVLDLSTFNKIAYDKKLQFKLLFIRTRIYVIVKDNTNTKSTIVAIMPPRWGGTSLRYLITYCHDEWCSVVMKKTSKGEIYSYQSLNQEFNEEPDISDIFD
jgi:hypothetical protein